MGMLIKTAGQSGLNNEMVVFLRNLFGLFFLLPWLLRLGLRNLATERLKLHAFRSVVGLSAMYCFFYAIPRIPLAEAVLLNYTVPIFTPLIAWYWLKEPANLATGFAVFLGFIGICLVLRPGFAGFHPASLVGLCSGVLAAVALTSIRKLTSTEPPVRVVFYFASFSLLISCLPACLSWQTLTSSQWLLMLGIGACATCGQMLITSGYQQAPAAKAGIFTYTAVLWAALFAWLRWGEQPTVFTWAGAMLIILAGLLASGAFSRRAKSA